MNEDDNGYIREVEGCLASVTFVGPNGSPMELACDKVEYLASIVICHNPKGRDDIKSTDLPILKLIDVNFIDEDEYTLPSNREQPETNDDIGVGVQ